VTGATEPIIHLHWIAKFIDYTSFFQSIDPGQPVVWTLHDMNAFTGGCHFSGGCERFRLGCGECPQLVGRGPDDLSRQFFDEKERALKDLNLHVVAPSRWLIESARSSRMFRNANSFSHFPYGISTSDYYPMERTEARARLGIDQDATVFCFGAMDIKNRRKGAREMLAALSAVADLPNVQGIVFGAGELPASSKPLPPLHQIGPVHGLLQQRALYSASDVFVLPSLEDNLPLTGLEAMACGTAIVGFDAGGIPDYVQSGKTGLLARTGDAEDLGHKLRTLINAPELAETMGRRARRRIEAEYSGDREADAYRSLYAGLVDSAATPLRGAA
jgi:glycosyltransferase involved in cell wall biosynthesis